MTVLSDLKAAALTNAVMKMFHLFHTRSPDHVLIKVTAHPAEGKVKTLNHNTTFNSNSIHSSTINQNVFKNIQFSAISFIKHQTTKI